MVDFSSFGIDDAALLGGIMGFVEESIKAEEEGELDLDSPEFDESFEEELSTDKNRRLLSLYKQNPELVKIMLTEFIKSHSQRKVPSQKEIDAINAEMKEELFGGKDEL
jgi:hypothetical protein